MKFIFRFFLPIGSMSPLATPVTPFLPFFIKSSVEVAALTFARSLSSAPWLKKPH